MKLIFPLLFICFFACKSETQVPSVDPAILGFSMIKATSSEMDKAARTITVYLSDDIDRSKLTAIFQLSAGTVARVNGKIQESSTTENDYSSGSVIYNLESADGTKANWTVTIQTNSEQIGLGKITASKSNERLYNWYIDQLSTGDYKIANGGVACIAMAMKWSDIVILSDPAVIRNEIDEWRKNTYERGAGLIGSSLYPADITWYLSKKEIPFQVISLPDKYESIKSCIDKEYILIVCPDMNNIEYDAQRYHRTGKFYETHGGYGHYIIIKGYRQVSGNNYFFEVYDPLSMGQLYEDTHTPKGKNRYYLDSQLETGMNINWDYAIVIGKRYRAMDQLDHAVNLNSIPFASGW